MASVYKRGRDKKKKGGCYTIEYRDHLGKQRFRKGFPDKESSDLLAAKLVHEVMLRRKGLIDVADEDAAARKSLPIGPYLDEFRKSIARGDNTSKHVDQTVGRIRRVLQNAEILTPGDIDYVTVEMVLREMVEAEEIGHKTHNHYLQAVDQFCKWLSNGQRQILPNNPIAGMSRLNTEMDVRHQRRALTQDEFWKLIDSSISSGVEIQCYDGFDRARIYLISYFTGLRRKEIASLTPRSFDLSGSPPTLTVEAGSSKHRKKDVLPLHSELTSRLRDWLADKGPDTVLFPKLAKRRTWLMVKKDLERAGIPYETPEGIADFHAAGRHTHITELLRNGATLPEAKELARHSDVRTTMKYTHIGIDDQAKALSSLPSRRTSSDQCFGQWQDGSTCPKESADVRIDKIPAEEKGENDGECPAMTAKVAGSSDAEVGFDPRRLHSDGFHNPTR